MAFMVALLTPSYTTFAISGRTAHLFRLSLAGALSVDNLGVDGLDVGHFGILFVCGIWKEAI
jgi:hypothetical protein